MSGNVQNENIQKILDSLEIRISLKQEKVWGSFLGSSLTPKITVTASLYFDDKIISKSQDSIKLES